jgi:UDP-2,3-diacylglucosamine pyrophosphatase LpxH
MTQIPFPTGSVRSLTLATGSVRLKTERAHTFEALAVARKDGLRISDYRLERDRIIILSDVHKGDHRSRVDDFVHNEALYCKVLDYYLNREYRLILNGDIEEGWKANYSQIIAAYEDTAFALERAFAQQGRYYRIYGNHDQDWADPRCVDRHLKPVFNMPLHVYPAVFLGPHIMIAHGHQGDPDSDWRAWLSRRVVRYVWRPFQRAFGLSNRRASDPIPHLRNREDHLSSWARTNRLLLIAGHTHRALFRPKLMSDPDTAIHARSAPVRSDSITHYLNDGCCVHADGITGIEIDRGKSG